MASPRGLLSLQSISESNGSRPFPISGMALARPRLTPPTNERRPGDERTSANREIATPSWIRRRRLPVRPLTHTRAVFDGGHRA